MKKNHVAFVLLAAVSFFGSCKKSHDVITTPKLPTATVDKSEMVLVPKLGLIPKANVHLIEPGYKLSINGSHILKVKESNGEMMEDFGPIHQSGSIGSPQSAPVNLSASTSNMKNAALQASTPPSPPPPKSIPRTDSQITMAASDFSPFPNNFSTNWIVPNAPISDHGQTLYISCGLAGANPDGSNATYLQPTLQWGATFAGGGKYWAISNWYVTGTGAYTQIFCTPAIAVNPGDSLQGVVTFDGRDVYDGSWNYSLKFTGYSNSLSIVDGVYPSGSKYNNSLQPGLVPMLSEGFEMLEAYDNTLTTVPAYTTDYPAQDDIRMTNIVAKSANGNINQNWYAINKSNYAQKSIIVSNSPTNGEIDIYFRTPVIAETDISKGDTCFYWTTAGMVSVGNSTNSAIFRSPVPYTLASGETTASIAGIALSATNQCYYWYTDGTMSVGTATNATAYAAQQKYTLPANETPANIIGMSTAKSTGHVYTWFKDGTFIIGNPLNLTAYAAANKFTIPSGKTAASIVGIGIAGSNDHIYAWYVDGTGNPAVSSGTSLKFDYYSAPIPASFY